MTDRRRADKLAARFEEQRPHLRAVGYRMLGSLAEAEDVVQDAWLRASRADTAAVENLGGWLTTIVARLCLDRLRTRASRREEPIDEALDAATPDPVSSSPDGVDPVTRQAIASRHLAAGARKALVNGSAGVVVFANGRPYAVIGLAFSRSRVVEMDFLVDPARLARLDLSAVSL